MSLSSSGTNVRATAMRRTAKWNVTLMLASALRMEAMQAHVSVASQNLATGAEDVQATRVPATGLKASETKAATCKPEIEVVAAM